ncbi:MAG: hypothetical protein IH602_05035 [Bryobacteraceae bacterium]|nr:hypothetical protein [Bryobacteraceae bacterium]
MAAAGLFLLVFLVYLVSPNATPFDSRWTVHTALSLIHEHNADLNEYTALLERDRWYAIECVQPDGSRIYPLQNREQCAGGKLYHFYPIAVPLLAAPVVGPAEWLLSKTRPLVQWVAPGPRRAFLSGDLASSSMMTELILASALVAAAAVVVFLFAMELSCWPAALTVALVFAFATPAWSTGSRALWMHGFSMLLLPAGLWAMWRGRWALAGMVFVLAFFARPTNVVGLGFAGIYALTAGRRCFGRFVLGGLPVALAFIAINLGTYGSVAAPFFFTARSNTPSLGLHPHMGEALWGNLISPSRGLLVYTPIVLFSFHGLWLWIRDSSRRALGLYMAAVLLGHYLLMSFYEDWFGGHCYGPRYMSDLSPLFALALLPLGRAARYAAIPALAISLFMHAQGAFCWPCLEWNTSPIELRHDQSRIWDWRDPPFLRNFRK